MPPARLTCRPEIETLTGRGVLDDLGPAFDDLLTSADAPVTNRRRWLSVWEESYPDAQTWAAAAWRGGRLDGICLFARRDHGGLLEITGLGHGRNDRSRFVARDPEAAEALVEAVAATLHNLRRPWTFRVEQLPVDDPVAAGLAHRVPGLALVAGGSIPGVDFAGGRDLAGHLTKNLRKQLRKAQNRMVDDSIDVDISFTRRAEGLVPLLDEVEAVHRGRDHDVGRSSDIDDESGRRLWRGVILEHIRADMVEIAALRIDGELAAYVVSLTDGERYRVLDGRFDTRFEHYSPGRVLETETLRHALEDDHFARLDWMNSVAPDKLISVNCTEVTQHLVGSSGPVD